MKANGRVQTLLRELRLPREERTAARQERRAEEAMRSQRDNATHSETARKAAAEANRQREGAAGGSGMGPSG
jgi:membrane protein involved in colicin uptake